MKKSILILAICATTCVSAFAQQGDFEAFKNLGIGLKVSPFMGYGLEAATGINNHLILRLGVNLTKGINAGYFNFELDESADLMERFGYIPDVRVKPSVDFTHVNLLLDYHPGGIFHVTVGIFAGATKLGVKGFLADSYNKPAQLLPGYTWPTVEIGDQTVEMKDGIATGSFRMGNAIKPYFGLGLGRAVSKNKRLAFKFELGALYQGASYALKLNGKTIDLANSTDEDLRDIHEMFTDNKQYISFWPQMNFQLSYRIF